MTEEQRFQVELAGGAVTAAWSPSDGTPRGLAVHAHGAGSDLDHRIVVGQALALAGAGLEVVRFNFPYRERGRGGPDRMPVLLEAFAAVVEAARARFEPERVFVGGQSMGGRAASMLTADGFAADGAILMAYPLHPAGKPEKLRDEHLPRIRVPVLCLNGTRDKLCTPELMESVLGRTPATFRMHWLEGADHGFHVLKRSGRTDAEVLEEVRGAVAGWLGGGPPGPAGGTER